MCGLRTKWKYPNPFENGLRFDYLSLFEFERQRTSV